MKDTSLNSLSELWKEEKEFYKNSEIGSGVQKFVKKVFACPELFNLEEGKLASKNIDRKNEFLEETSKKRSRADVVIFIDSDIVIPVEVEKFGKIKDGERQIFNYQKDWVKKYGILTDGNEWRFYNNTLIEKTFYIDDILSEPHIFLTFWNEYITTEYYYQSFFEKKGKLRKYEFIPNLDDSREEFFNDITKLIENFKNKLNLKSYFEEIEDETEKEKSAVEITYAYIIQFILYKTLVDNAFVDFEKDWNDRLESISNAINSKNYATILSRIRGISNKISNKIYKRFSDEQELINDRLNEILNKPKNKIEDVSVWLDILLFINRYNFSNVKNEFFGYVYENYLKDLYLNEKKGQYFTDPNIVDFMLDEIGYKSNNLKKRFENDEESISIIDPSCGSGTFLYNATNRIVDTFFENTKQSSKQTESIINNNIFGLDIAEFPLYLAEMNILMRMLPLVINEKYNNPVEQKIKVFKTRDSIAEFLDTAIRNTITDTTTEWKKNQGQLDLFAEALDLDYESHMRDKRDLNQLKQSLENQNKIPRQKFDFVIGNPPYVGYNQCSKQGLLIFELIKSGQVKLNDIYGVNLHSVEGHRKVNRPNPNLYLFFISLGIALLKDNGKLVYIIPRTLLTAGDFDVMRYHLSKYVTIEKIITFSNAMFVGRGIQQKNKVPTSSLIFVIKKIPPNINSIEVVKHKSKQISVEKSINEIISKKYIEVSNIKQEALLTNYVNWNFILFEKKYLELYNKYRLNTTNISLYYDHIQAKQFLKSKFIFDGGYNINEKIKLTKKPQGECYSYPRFNSKSYKKFQNVGFWPNDRDKNSPHFIGLRQANQEYSLLDSKYKIVWSYANTKRFYFTDKKVIWARNQYNAIGSAKKEEILYLFSLLNSKLNTIILLKNVKSENEKDVLISITSIKNFVRIPEIKQSNISIKKELILQAQQLLDCESFFLKDFANFKNVLQQKFDKIELKDKKLYLSYKDNHTICEISEYEDLIKSILKDELLKIINKDGTYSLNDLKSIPMIDLIKQNIIKDYIDDLVFSLYFKIKLENVGFEYKEEIKEKCKQHKFYKLINNQ